MSVGEGCTMLLGVIIKCGNNRATVNQRVPDFSSAAEDVCNGASQLNHKSLTRRAYHNIIIVNFFDTWTFNLKLPPDV